MKVWAEDRSLCVSEIEREEKVKGGILHAIIVLVMSNFLKTLIFPQPAQTCDISRAYVTRGIWVGPQNTRQTT